MAIPSSIVGASTEPITHEIDARWLMAYAAGLGDHNPRYLDTLRPDGIVGHPLFPVCPEWPVVLGSRDVLNAGGTPPDEQRRGVHATHDLRIHRLVRPGDVLRTTSRILGVEQRKPGAFLLTQMTTTDADGEVVFETWQGGLYLGVPVHGADRVDGRAPPPPPPTGAEAPGERHTRREVPIPAGAAHVYTECARIWNPIHTDPVVAEAAGLPGIILHGTATLAHGVTAVVEEHCGGDPSRVERIVGRFGAMVPMPSTIEITTRQVSPHTVALDATNSAGQRALRDAFVFIKAEAW